MIDRKTIMLTGSDEAAAAQMKRYLSGNGHVVLYEKDRSAVCARIQKESPDMVVLDIDAFDRTGLEICREMRRGYGGTILILTDRDDDLEQIFALDSGADDVLTKPVSTRLLLARINALLRRWVSRSKDVQGRCITIRDLKVSASRREACLNGKILDLTTIQFDLLWCLVSNAGYVVSRDDLYKDLFNSEYNGLDRSIDVYISRLRQKIGDDPAKPFYLKTVRGQGYLFAED